MSAGDIDADLLRRATEFGVLVHHEGYDGTTVTADPDVVEHVVAALAADRADGPGNPDPVHLDPGAPILVDGTIGDAELTVEGVAVPVTPSRDGRIDLPPLPLGCHDLRLEVDGRAVDVLVVAAPPNVPGLDTDRRWSALFAPAYALWDDERPLPSYGHLGDLGEIAAHHGIDMVATLPLYASFAAEPSPYSPISRLHWNECYLSDDDLPDVEPSRESVAVRQDDAVGTFGAVDWPVLAKRRRRQLEVAAEELTDTERAQLDLFVAHCPDVGDYARYRATTEAGGDPLVERSHALAQLRCDRELTEVNQRGVSLALDLPIGSHPDGYEAWQWPELFASDMSVGAPPDAFFTGGQDWGFPPQLPGAARRSGYRLWRSMIERVAGHAALLRIDHVMAVHRLWWVPEGQPADRGVYVLAPADELLAVIAATAAATGIGVVGENLGTVPPAVVEALDRWSMLGMYEEQFHMGVPLAPIPARSVAGIRTHDMAAFAAHATTTDLRAYRAALEGAALGGGQATDLVDLVLERLARSPARMVVADLDDLLGEHRPHNLPGRIVPGIWQRRLDRSLGALRRDRAFTRRLDLLTGARHDRRSRARQ